MLLQCTRNLRRLCIISEISLLALIYLFKKQGKITGFTDFMCEMMDDPVKCPWGIAREHVKKDSGFISVPAMTEMYTDISSIYKG